jgi:glycosyltransferase involved in cell wall biosynthesis
MFNEEAGAAACVAALAAVLPDGARLIAVDDGSSDATCSILDGLEPRYESLHVVRRNENGGYGAALRSGAEAATRLGVDWVLFMDSDLTNPPGDILRFAELLDDRFDYVKASRFLENGGMTGVPARRQAMTLVANRVARLAAGGGITDPTNGFRAVRTAAFLAMPLTERGFAIIMEELYWALHNGLRIGELPSVLSGRDEEQRPSAFGYRPAVLWAYSRHTLRIARLRVSRRLR